jgi:hypothetical protein
LLQRHSDQDEYSRQWNFRFTRRTHKFNDHDEKIWQSLELALVSGIIFIESSRKIQVINLTLQLQSENPDKLTKSCLKLKEILFQIEDLKLIKPNVFLDPFLEVIRSEETTGPITSLALSAINKFLSYGLIGEFFQFNMFRWIF